MKKRKAKYKPDVSKVPDKLKRQTATEMHVGYITAKRSGKKSLGPVTRVTVDYDPPREAAPADPDVQMPDQVRRQAAIANAHFGVVGHDAHLFQLEQHLAAATKLIGELWR
jgi:hypothetical protein